MLRDAGIQVPAGRIVRDADDAAAALAELGAPVAMKLSAADLRHKSEAGAVVLGLATEAEVRAAHARLLALPAAAGAAVLVERMAAPGVELLVTARRDAVVPALAIGLGGIWTELLGDVAVIPLPAGADRIEAALRGLRAGPLLTGGPRAPGGRHPAPRRDSPRRWATSIASAGLELLELNPVIVHEAGAVAVDALARTRGAPS